MDIGRIKKLVKDNGDKIVLVEEGEPEIVMMSFSEYEKLAGFTRVSDRSAPPVRPASIFDEPLGLVETRVDMEETPGLPVRSGDIRLEDLPL